eukprot:Gb_00667 [translate_table: standard]
MARKILYEHPRLRFLCAIVSGLIVVVGLTVLIIWLSLQPHKPKYYLDYGSVSQFKITSDGLVDTNVRFNITTRNSNRRIGIYYDRIQLFLLYDDEEIGWASLSPFYQGHKNTTFLHANVAGQLVSLHPDVSRDLKLEHSSGKVDLMLRLYARIRFKVGSWKSKHYTLKMKCKHAIMHVQGGSFDHQKCKVDV